MIQTQIWEKRLTYVCRQRNTKHTPTSHVKDTHTYTRTTAHTALLIHVLVKNTRETYTKQRRR